MTTMWRRWQDYATMLFGVLLLAIITFIAPFVLGFATVTGIAWTAWVLAVLTVVVAATFLLNRQPEVVKTA